MMRKGNDYFVRFDKKQGFIFNNEFEKQIADVLGKSFFSIFVQ